MRKGRYEKDTEQMKLDFSQLLDIDWKFAEWDIICSIAHAEMLNKIDIITDNEFYTGYFDGASRGNPGLAGAGAWISDGKSKEPIWESSNALGIKTNNEAEYSALIDLLNELRSRGAKKAVIRGDSKLVIEQMSGRWKVKEPRLIELYEKAKLLAEEMQLTFEWISREHNLYADRLSNKAIV